MYVCIICIERERDRQTDRQIDRIFAYYIYTYVVRERERERKNRERLSLYLCTTSHARSHACVCVRIVRVIRIHITYVVHTYGRTPGRRAGPIARAGAWLLLCIFAPACCMSCTFTGTCMYVVLMSGTTGRRFVFFLRLPWALLGGSTARVSPGAGRRRRAAGP